MSADRRIQAAATPSEVSVSGRLTPLPSEVLAQSCKRVGIASLVFASLWAIGLLMANVVARWTDVPLVGHTHPWPMPGNLIAATGLLLSVAMIFVAGRLQHRPNLLLDLGLGFEIITAFLIGLLQMWVPPADVRAVSWVWIIILVYPTIAPNTPGKIFIASLLAATMDPIGLGVAKLRGVTVSWTTAEAAWAFAPSYICAALAVLPAHIIRGLGRQVRKAKELGAYKLGDSIGRGGMGEVLHAEHRLLARPAAIKIIRPEVLGAASASAQQVALERFKREAQAAATLRSPHTIELYDFGLVKADRSREQTMLTQPHMTTGTPAFMAPELALGEPDIDRRVDIYALGSVLYWLLTGQLVFEADSPIKMMHRHISDTPEPPSTRTELEVPAELDDLILACLAKRAEDRPATVDEVGRRLAEVPVVEPWTEARAQRWWETHLPEAQLSTKCDKGELAPVVTSG